MTDAWLDTPKGEALWRTDARQRGCYCADKAKPCPYHEGYEDGGEAAARALMTDAPCDTCGGRGKVDVAPVIHEEPDYVPCPAGCDNGIRRAPLIPRVERDKARSEVASLRAALRTAGWCDCGHHKTLHSGPESDYLGCAVALCDCDQTRMALDEPPRKDDE